MPTYLRNSNYEISRRSVIVDTNVLVGAFSAHDQHYDAAQIIFDPDFADDILVPFSVIVETWGMLTRYGKGSQSKERFLTWLTTPGTGAVPVVDEQNFDAAARDLARHNVDCVDILLVRLATDVSRSIDLNPPITIATFDTRDFLMFVARTDFRFVLFDMNSYEQISFQ